MSIHKIVQELREAARFESTEASDYWNSLLNVEQCSHNCASDEFIEAIEKELRAVHADVFNNYELVEESVTHTKKRKILRWKEEE
jgi:hypothetical protein